MTPEQIEAAIRDAYDAGVYAAGCDEVQRC